MAMGLKKAKDLAGADGAPEQAAPAKAKKKPRHRKKIIISVVALVLAGAVTVYFLTREGGSGTALASLEYSTYTVERRSIISSLSGSGTLQPADSYTVTGLVSGEILEAPFEEGDVISKDSVLYRIDPKNAEQSIKTAEDNVESAQQSLEKAQKSYNDLLSDKSKYDKDRAEDREKLKLNSKVSGQITKLYVEVGDTVNSGATIADVLDSTVMLLTLPFLEDDAASLRVGNSAVVTLSSTGETLSGKVDEVSSVKGANSRGVPVRDVTIAVSNPGGIYAGMSASAEAGGAACNDEGTFAYKTKDTIKATKAGEIATLNVKEGDRVTEGQRILNLKESDDTIDYAKQLSNAADTIKDAERTLEKRLDSLETAKEALDDYVITSPIDGTVIEKTYKAGDKVGGTSGNSAVSMAIIYDLSSLTFELNVDELDVSQMEVGQQAVITADAVDGRAYIGTVTRISVKGTTSSGVTSYPVTIEITETDGLLPGMNVSAEIIVANSENTLAIPSGALSRGNRVLKQTAPDADPNAPLPEGSFIPDGFEYVQVTVGVADDNYIEIIDGLSEGDVIAYRAVAATTTDNMFAGMNGMNGSFVITDGGGAMPAGGGQMPQGGGQMPQGGYSGTRGG